MIVLPLIPFMRRVHSEENERARSRGERVEATQGADRAATSGPHGEA
jgi:hypothetical protein